MRMRQTAGVILLGLIVGAGGRAADGTLTAAPALGAQIPLPVRVSLNVAGHGSSAVEVHGTTAPGTVVSVRGATAVVGASGEFTLKTALPVALVAVKGQQIRRVSMALPSGAQRWLDRLTVGFDLTTMRAEVEGALTIRNHPPATVTVEHVQAGSTVRTPVTKGAFTLALPLVLKTNTLDWSLRAGWLSWVAPPLTFEIR